MIIRTGIINFSRPFNACTTLAIPALIAPVFIVTPKKSADDDHEHRNINRAVEIADS